MLARAKILSNFRRPRLLSRRFRTSFKSPLSLTRSRRYSTQDDLLRSPDADSSPSTPATTELKDPVDSDAIKDAPDADPVKEFETILDIKPKPSSRLKEFLDTPSSIKSDLPEISGPIGVNLERRVVTARGAMQADSIIVSNLPTDVEESHIRELAEKYGPVHKIQILPQYGTGIINFKHAQDAHSFLTASEKAPHRIGQNELKLKMHTYYMYNAPRRARALAGFAATQWLHLSDFPPHVSERDLRKILQTFEGFEDVILAITGYGKPKGYASVSFSSVDAAVAARSALKKGTSHAFGSESSSGGVGVVNFAYGPVNIPSRTLKVFGFGRSNLERAALKRALGEYVKHIKSLVRHKDSTKPIYFLTFPSVDMAATVRREMNETELVPGRRLRLKFAESKQEQEQNGPRLPAVRLAMPDAPPSEDQLSETEDRQTETEDQQSETEDQQSETEDRQSKKKEDQEGAV